MTNQEIITRGELIRDETVTGANTGQRVGEAFVAIGENLQQLDSRDEPIAFTGSKAMNAFIKKLYVDISGYNGELTLLNLYAGCSQTNHNFSLRHSPSALDSLIFINLDGSGRYCFRDSNGIFVDLEIDEASLSAVAVSNDTILTSFAQSKAYDPRTENDGFTESPLLNKYIQKVWVEFPDDYENKDSIVNNLCIYTLSNKINNTDGEYHQILIIRFLTLSTNEFLYNETDSPSQITITRSDGLKLHAIIDWKALEGIEYTYRRTKLTPKAYDVSFWKTPVSDNVGDDSSIAFSQKGAKTLAQEIAAQEENIENLGLITKLEYGGSDLVEGYFNTGSVAVGSKITQTNPGIISPWYCLMPISVKEDDTIVLKTLGGSNGRAWCLTDASKSVLSKADADIDTTETAVTLTVSADGFLYVNHKATYDTEANKNKFYLKITRNAIGKALSDINELAIRLENATGTFPKMYNPTVNFDKSELRVLDIGNSFTNNAVGIYAGGSEDNLSSFVSAAGINVSDMCLYRAIRSGGTFKNWYDIYNDDDDESYSITKHIGGLSIPSSSVGTGPAGDGSKFRSCLQNTTWDIILIHQASAYSACDLNVLEGNDERGYLKEFIRLLRTLQPSASIGFLFTHVSNRDAVGDTAAKFRQICLSIKQVCNSYDIDFVIPVGAALENLRASSLNTTSNKFSEDNHHLAAGLGKYVAAATYFESLFAPRYGVSVYGNSFNTVNIDSTVIGSHTSYSDNFVAVTATNAGMAQKCAMLAVKYPWNISNPSDFQLQS